MSRRDCFVAGLRRASRNDNKGSAVHDMPLAMTLDTAICGNRSRLIMLVPEDGVKWMSPHEWRCLELMDTSASPYPELDLHRLTVEEAMSRLDQFLYEMYAAGIHSVRIVHGKGTGKLRSSIRIWLPRQTLVKSFRTGFPWEGGDGVTIVELAD